MSAKTELSGAEQSVKRAKTESSRKSRERAVKSAATKVTSREQKLAAEEKELSKREAKLSKAQQDRDKERSQDQQSALKSLDQARTRYERARISMSANRSSPTGPQLDARTVPAKQWDLFLSHASEDKSTIANKLVDALESEGLEVWYDKATLRIGDSLRAKIDEGLRQSYFGIVVITHNFFAKQWPQRELDGLIAKEDVLGRKVMLPVWHHISMDEVADYSPTLVSRKAGDTAIQTLSEISKEIAEVVEEFKSEMNLEGASE